MRCLKHWGLAKLNIHFKERIGSSVLFSFAFNRFSFKHTSINGLIFERLHSNHSSEIGGQLVNSESLNVENEQRFMDIKRLISLKSGYTSETSALI